MRRTDRGNPVIVWGLVGVIVLLVAAIAYLVSSGSLFEREPTTDLERDYELLLAGAKETPDNGPLLMTLAEVEYDLGREDDALEHAEQAVGYAGDQEGIQLRYAQLLVRSGRMEEAREALLAEIENDKGSKNAEAYFVLAQVDADAGDYESAIGYMEQGLAITPVAADMRIVYGRILEEAGRESDAVAQYQQALKYLPGNEEATAALERLGVEVETDPDATMPGGIPTTGTPE